MTTQEHEKDRTLLWTGLLAGGFVSACAILAVVAGSMVYAAQQNPKSGAPGMSVGAIHDGSALALDQLAGAATTGGYQPSSAYIEEGADSDEQVIGFGAGEGTGGGGVLSDSAVKGTITRHQNELIQCYAQSLDEDPDLQGRVDFHFRVAGDGHVAMVKVTRSRLADKATEDCFVRAARGWKFPATGGELMTRFDTDFNFTFE